MTASKIFLFFCLSFIGGIFLNSLFRVPQLLGLGLLISGILLISVFWSSSNNRKRLVVAGFCLLVFAAGIWRHQQAELRIKNNELRKYNDLGREIVLIGVISGEPNIKEKSQNLVIKNIEIPLSQKLTEVRPPTAGRVLVTANKYPENQYGDKVEIKGRLETPPVFAGFNYRNYLKKDGIYSVMFFPEIKLLAGGFGNPVISRLFSFKNKIQETSRQFISPPQIGILEALVFGEEQNISQEWKDKLNSTGLRHITAVSGMNITIIIFIIFNFLLGLGFWRQQAIFLSIALIIIYILMIGAPASALRAAVMGILLILAQFFGRVSQAQRAIAMAAALMLFLNPLLLKLDIGFQLSFLAVLGLIYFQPFLFDFLNNIPNPKFFPLRTTLSATLSAQIFTLPILVYNFGQIPIFSFLPNILVVPVLAPLTILIFIFGISGAIFLPFGFLFYLPTWFSLTYIVKVIDFFSKIPLSLLQFNGVHWFWLIISYLILGYSAFLLKKRQGLKFLQY